MKLDVATCIYKCSLYTVGGCIYKLGKFVMANCDVAGIYSEICVQRIFYIYGIHSDIFRYLYIFRDINIGIYSDILGIFIMVYIQIHSDIFRYSEIYITSEIFICA